MFILYLYEDHDFALNLRNYLILAVFLIPINYCFLWITSTLRSLMMVREGAVYVG